jgi:lipopolysaccharide export LptBFGC system permease protein LptF
MSARRAATTCAVLCVLGTSMTVFSMVSEGISSATLGALIPNAVLFMIAIGLYRHAGRT